MKGLGGFFEIIKNKNKIEDYLGDHNISNDKNKAAYMKWIKLILSKANAPDLKVLTYVMQS